jgi:glycine cleavage system H protein
MNPTDRRYSKEHEWARVESPGLVVVGITHYAQDQLGDVVYVELPSTSAEVKQFQKLGEIESVKAVSDIFSPVGGQVVEINGKLEGQPELVNDDPTGEGWMLKLRAENADAEMANLLSAEEYEAFLETEAH